MRSIILAATAIVAFGFTVPANAARMNNKTIHQHMEQMKTQDPSGFKHPHSTNGPDVLIEPLQMRGPLIADADVVVDQDREGAQRGRDMGAGRAHC